LIGVDKDLDLALLEFENQDKPFSKGLPFYDKPLQDGDGVFSAGFPALGNQRLWQLGRGFVTNATARIEDLLDPELSTLIQHSAQIDAGNSGGPLMVRPSDNDPQMYVVGINTWKADSRQDVNLSLPADKIIQFMEAKQLMSAMLNVTNCSILPWLPFRKACTTSMLSIRT